MARDMDRRARGRNATRLFHHPDSRTMIEPRSAGPRMTAPKTFSDPQTTRDRLIAAAFRVVAREGLDAASVKMIAVDAERDFFKVRLAFAAAALTNPALAAVVCDLNAAAAHETALTLAAARGEETPTSRDREIGLLLKATFDGVFLSLLNDPDFPIDAAADDIERAVRLWST